MDTMVGSTGSGRTGVHDRALLRRAAVAAAALAVTAPLTLCAAGAAGAAGTAVTSGTAVVSGTSGTSGAVDAEVAAVPAWSTIGRTIVFARYDAAEPVEDLYGISSLGGTPVRLTHTPDVSDVMPSWSPDGTRVAFLRYSLDGTIDGIWTMKASGDDLKPVPGTKDASDPAWSPDGTRIAYSRPVDSQREIYVADVDGTPATRLTTTPEDEFHPTWSPDGKNLAFSRVDTTSGNSRLLRVELSTLTQTPITLAFSHDWTPDWSRGNRIVFSRLDSTGFTHLYDIRPDGSGVRQITSGQANDKFPSWSPDGRRLVFTRGGTDDADPEHLFLVRADGTGLKQLTKTASHDLEADWRP